VMPVSGRSAWGRSVAARRQSSISEIRRSRSGRSILPARRSFRRTSAGTQGIVAAANRADRLYAASLVTADATVKAMLAGEPEQISIIAMGGEGVKCTDEDEVCAIHLRDRLEGRSGDRRAVQRLILAGGEVSRFHDPARPHLHQEDVEIALDIDRYDFAIRVRIEDGRPVGRMEQSG
jgi:2-phosphosulfolactate phosphatase